MPHRSVMPVPALKSFLLFLAGFLCVAAPSFADSQVRIVRLSFVEGDVQIDRRDSQGFNSAFSNMPLTEGVRIWTRNDGRAELEFEDGSTARLTPSTIIEFDRLRLGNDGRRETTVALQQGEAYFDLKKHPDDFHLTFAQQEVTVKKSSHFRIAVDKTEAEVATFKGEVELRRSSGERIQIGKDRSYDLVFSDQSATLQRGTPSDPQDAWDHEREQQRETYAQVHDSYSSYNAYSTSTGYGSYDLNQYGNYSWVPGYGYLWRPYGFNYGWDPFANGNWVYYPTQGYVWVSPYRWGWTPFHYGSWVNVNGLGWCWRPSRNFNNWNGVPVISNPPSGFVNLTPPSVPPAVVPNATPVVPVGNPAAIDPALRAGRTRRGEDGTDTLRNRVLLVPGMSSSSANTPATNPQTATGIVGSRPAAITPSQTPAVPTLQTPLRSSRSNQQVIDSDGLARRIGRLHSTSVSDNAVPQPSAIQQPAPATTAPTSGLGMSTKIQSQDSGRSGDTNPSGDVSRFGRGARDSSIQPTPGIQPMHGIQPNASRPPAAVAPSAAPARMNSQPAPVMSQPRIDAPRAPERAPRLEAAPRFEQRAAPPPARMPAPPMAAPSRPSSSSEGRKR